MAAFLVRSKCLFVAVTMAAIMSLTEAGCLGSISSAHVLASAVAGRIVSVLPCLWTREDVNQWLHHHQS